MSTGYSMLASKTERENVGNKAMNFEQKNPVPGIGRKTTKEILSQGLVPLVYRRVHGQGKIFPRQSHRS